MPMTMTERLEHARVALTAYFQAKGEPLPEGPWDYEDTDTSDLIADLLHLQKRLGERGTLQTLRTAMLHFDAEEEEEPHYPCALCQSVDTAKPKGKKRPGNPEPTCSSRCQAARVIESAAEVLVPEPAVITIQIHRGLMTDISGLPPGYALHVEDYDVDDTEHPDWNAEEECTITVYEADTV